MQRPQRVSDAQKTRNRSKITAIEPTTPTEPEGLIRLLIRHSEPALGTTPGRPVVILDLKVDTYRCVLIRQSEAIAEAIELSPREQEISRLVAKGLPNKVIARILDISTWTVGTYLRRIFAKLAVTSRAAMVAKLGELQTTMG